MADPIATKGPDNPSSDYGAMKAYWAMVDAILGGAEAMRDAGERYLPKFENEDPLQYDRRRRVAPFTNIYGDISRNLAAKPFSRELALKDEADPSIQALCEDIDGQGNNLHTFAEGTFQRGLDKAVDWIFVDHTKVDAGERVLSIAEERSLGVRPYWVHVPAERMLAVYSDREGGQEVFVHARISEPFVQREGYDEVTKDRVRVLNREPTLDEAGNVISYAPPTYEVFEKRKGTAGVADAWVSIEGPKLITIGIIPIAPFVTGKRHGASWRIRPPLRDIAHLQIDAYQQESNLKSILDLAGYPMLAGNGVDPRSPTEADPNAQVRVPVGPGAVLFAPPGGDGNHGEWTFIEPAGTSIDALEKRLEATQTNMRDLGMQPLTQANLTVITTANISIKAHSAVQAWALKLKDALEQALKFTALWMGDVSKAPEVDIYTDFGVELGDDNDVANILKAEDQGVIDARTCIEELKRRSFLSENVNIDEVQKRLAEQQQGLEPEQEIDPRTGQPIVRPPVPDPRMVA